jgi:nucleoid-associated protein YgaU
MFEDLAGGRLPATLTCVKPMSQAGMVMFDFNPQEISMQRSPTFASEGSQSELEDPPKPVALKSSPLKISVNNIYFEGMGAKGQCDRLLDWLAVKGGVLGQLASAIFGANLVEEMPLLIFNWGPPMIGFFYMVHLHNVTIKYERFTPYGIPIRAKASLTMQVSPELSLLSAMPTNPTSGGLAGRREHIVAQGDNLPAIALRYFDTPGAWRPIAAINGIKDPMRLRPGQRVFIPNPEELDGNGER